MTPFSQLSTNEFRVSLTPAILRTGQIIHIALAAAPLILLIMVTIVGMTAPEVPQEEADMELMMPLTGGALFVLTVMLAAGRILFNSRLSDDALQKAESTLPVSNDGTLLPDSPSIRAVAVIRSAMLLRSVVTETSAMIGLVVLIIAATGGYLFTVPWIWLNTLPLVVHTLMIFMTFPTADRLTAIFEKKIKQR